MPNHFLNHYLLCLQPHHLTELFTETVSWELMAPWVPEHENRLTNATASQGLMPSVGGTQLLTVYIKTFNARFLKQKQPQNSRPQCCSFCEKGHSAGTKSTSISLIVATSEDNILFPNPTSSHIPYFSSSIRGLHTHCPHLGPPEYLEPFPFWCFVFSL